MQEKAFQWMLDPLASTLVACKKHIDTGETEIVFKATKDFERFCPVSSEEREYLLSLWNFNPKEYIYRIIIKNIENRLLLECLEGSNHILPNEHQQDYQKAIRFSTGNFQIYFVDDAVEKFRNHIIKLVDKNHSDSICHIKNQIFSNDCRNLVLDLRDSDEHKSGRQVFYSKDEGLFKNSDFTLYYRVFSDLGLSEIELKELEEIMDIYVQKNGTFYSMEYDGEEFVGNSFGNLKIKGIKKYPELIKKAHQLFK
ncbi:MAG: hypothetical protein E7168_02180 [Firmicutes bacterium]|nr:hypothetical protein [Bacillota bacterium]